MPCLIVEYPGYSCVPSLRCGSRSLTAGDSSEMVRYDSPSSSDLINFRIGITLADPLGLKESAPDWGEVVTSSVVQASGCLPIWAKSMQLP